MAETEDEKESKILDFLEKKAAIGILARLDAEEGMIIKTLDNKTHVSHSTVSNTIDLGEEADLLQRTNVAGDHGNARRVQLTERGKKLKREFDYKGMDNIYEHYFELHKKLELKNDQLQDWVKESDITDPDWPYPHREPDPDDYR